MELQELKEQLVDLFQDGLDDLDEIETTRRGLRLSFMSGDQFEMTIRDVTEEGDDDEDDKDDDDSD